MSNIGKYLLSASLIFSAAVVIPAQAQTNTAATTPATTVSIISPLNVEIEKAGQDWATALASRKVENIVSLYDPQAVLLATFTNQLDTTDKISAYFTGLVKKEGLKVQYNEQKIRILDENTAMNCGLYTFSYTENGKVVEVPARYTFIYEKKGDSWTIVQHHSSIRPEK
jgi:uncharacterized protein (TIGR02246 family)